MSDRSALTPRLVLAIASQTALGCVFLGKSENASLMKDHLNHVASKKKRRILSQSGFIGSFEGFTSFV